MIEKISRDEETLLLYGKTLDLIANHLGNNIEINELETGTRSKLLVAYANHAFHGGNNQAYLLNELIRSLNDDLSSL